SNGAGAQGFAPSPQTDVTSGLLVANAVGNRYGLEIPPLSPPPLTKGAIQNLDDIAPLVKGGWGDLSIVQADTVTWVNDLRGGGHV
ncbi:MAG: hypothetical protein O3A14_16300, partial [Cyanobacteria bacterium]|nr:hypothetical protein [Cyanobacteriota bacterium]